MLKIGDVVKYRGCGQPMTVTSVNGSIVDTDNLKGINEVKFKKINVNNLDLTVKCLTCHEYSDINENEYHCPHCGSHHIVEIGGLQ